MTAVMTSGALAALYATGFPDSRAWAADEFTALLAQPSIFLTTSGRLGFVLARVILDEAEVITLTIATSARGKGLGRRMLQDFETAAFRKGARRAFLEVAADNVAALALYQSCGWRESGRRRGYYQRKGGPGCDAFLFEKQLT